MVARGLMVGLNQPVILHLLDIEPATHALNGVKMELLDSNFPLLKGVNTSFNSFRHVLISINYFLNSNYILLTFFN